MPFRLKSLFSVGLLALLGVMLGALNARADSVVQITVPTVNIGTGTFSTSFQLDTTTNTFIGGDPTAITGGTFDTFTFDSALSDYDQGSDGDYIDQFIWEDASSNEITFKVDFSTLPLTAESETQFSGLKYIPANLAVASPPPAAFVGSITDVSVATPEPSSISLLLIGLVALGTLAAVNTRKPQGRSQIS